MAIPVTAFVKFEVVGISPISDSIRKLGVITCDICKEARASHDLFVKGIEGVAFLKRCCDQCVKNLT